MTDRGGRILSRLGILVPLTPWPVILWMSTQDHYPLGRHTASPIHSVGSECLIINLVLSSLGAVLILLGSQTVGSLDHVKSKCMFIALLALNWWIQNQWILSASYVEV